MDHKSHKSKKRKGGDTLNAGSFKKALVSPLPNVSGAAGVFGNGDTLAELDLLGGIQSADDDSSGSDEESHAQAAKSSQPKRILAQATFVHTSASSTSGEPSKSSMATMADLLASAGDNNERHNASSVSDDVIKMQQQLQQQIPLDPETNTRLREQIMESMTGIPTMQMIIEQNLASNSTTNANTNNSAVADTHSSVPDASTMLMSLSHDPSILATMKPAEHTEPTSSSSKSSKKKSKSKSTTTATTSASSKPKISTVPQRSLEDQLAADMGSDNPLHTKWLMATALKEKGNKRAFSTWPYSCKIVFNILSNTTLNNRNRIPHWNLQFTRRRAHPTDHQRVRFASQHGRGCDQPLVRERKRSWTL